MIRSDTMRNPIEVEAKVILLTEPNESFQGPCSDLIYQILQCKEGPIQKPRMKTNIKENNVQTHLYEQNNTLKYTQHPPLKIDLLKKQGQSWNTKNDVVQHLAASSLSQLIAWLCQHETR